MTDQSLEDAFRRICATEAPLSERLTQFSEAVRRFSRPFADAYDSLVERIRSGEAGATAPEPGDTMPPFLLPDGNNRLVSLDELLDRGPTVISFNRGHWCEYCLIELTAFREGLNGLKRQGAQVVSIMPETQEFISQMRGREAFPVLSDIDNGYALEVGLAIWLGEEVKALYLEYGLRLEKFNGNGTWFLPIPATFVVGQDGRIVDRYVDPDFRNRMEISAIFAAVEKARALL
jgi:peroxiredoxin